MDNPKVSIITPTFNRANLIIETLFSIQQQTFVHWEWIVVDDGSTDNTATLFQDFATDPRIKFFQRPQNLKKGANICRNYGVSKSVGTYFIFLDSDDVLAPNCLQNRVTYLEKTNLDLLVFDMGLIKDGTFEKYVYPDLSQKTRTEIMALFISGPLPWNMTRPIWEKKFFLKHQGFNEKMLLLDDDEFNLRAVNDPEIKFKFINETDCYYRIYEENTLKTSDAIFLKKMIFSHLILLQTLNSILSNEQKRQYRKSLHINMVNLLYYVGDAHVLKKRFLKNVLYFFRNFESSLQFKTFFISAIVAKLYPSNIKGSYSINRYFKDKLSSLP